MRKVILISGKAESGKTTAARIIQEELSKRGYKALVMSFAGYLKFICKEYYEWDGRKDSSGRSLLQRLGTDVVRKKNPDFWVNTVYDFIQTFSDEFDYFILDDTRFKNEISYFHDRDSSSYVSIKINRLNFENSLTAEQRLHPSEVDLDGEWFDIEILSESGTDNLKEAVGIFIFNNPNSLAMLAL